MVAMPSGRNPSVPKADIPQPGMQLDLLNHPAWKQQVGLDALHTALHAAFPSAWLDSSRSSSSSSFSGGPVTSNHEAENTSTDALSAVAGWLLIPLVHTGTAAPAVIVSGTAPQPLDASPAVIDWDLLHAMCCQRHAHAWMPALDDHKPSNDGSSPATPHTIPSLTLGSASAQEPAVAGDLGQCDLERSTAPCYAVGNIADSPTQVQSADAGLRSNAMNLKLHAMLTSYGLLMTTYSARLCAYLGPSHLTVDSPMPGGSKTFRSLFE